MQDNSPPADKEEWVIWNGTFGILAMGSTGQVETGPGGRMAWLAPPFEMLGPFSLDELETTGRIAFEACIVMSRRRWQDDQVELRRASHEKRRASQERMHGRHSRFNSGRNRRRLRDHPVDEKQYREILNLPMDGKLAPAQIKTAFRRLAQKAHPDVGGSHEQFLRITEARNALLEPFS